ncbi:unnamed protein product [Gongylonema pulchrum]|uniref:proton-translocating NAD(P)(+) transhydrogenase n=1 Tax=Gongylonema pulchrum TaxID=637853 RepID=A0A183D715_9BILA|nr:unnamed protein product [Gongylonema pulchrum]
MAYGKLQGLIDSAAIRMPGRNVINSALGLANVAAMAVYMNSSDHFIDLSMLGATSLLSSIIGVTLTMAIGGADMPVVITVLNSYSGWALCAEGFMLNNDLLTIAMNRSIVSVILGGVGTKSQGKGQAKTLVGTATETTSEQVLFSYLRC